MPKLIIDNIEVEVPPGTNVLEAARKIGVVIPHFCYHPALGSVGACRLCAMKFIDGPVKGLQMSCMIPAQDGMVVSTTDDEAARMRELVIEWLMENHPHDCPVCDEGGECLLQDYTIAGGHALRRFTGKKRTFVSQDLGPYIHHEMNRCIECYRCVRFYQDYAGGDDFGVMGSAGRVYFGRFREGKLESPFSGNLVDICPTGVFTDKTARYRARYWDYEMAPSVCPHCSAGCNIIPVGRYRELLKTVARVNDEVNGWFICDRGRFTNWPVNDPKRPRTHRVFGEEATRLDALDTLAARLKKQKESGTIALIGSSQLSLEALALLPKLAAAVGGKLCLFETEAEKDRTVTAISLIPPQQRASQEDIRQADFVAIAGADLLAESPMIALAVRQAARKGGKIFLVGELPPEAGRLPFVWTAAETFADLPVADAARLVIVCGGGAETTVLRAAAALPGKKAFLLAGPNSFAAGLLGMKGLASSREEVISGGNISEVVAFEADGAELPAGLKILAAADWRPTPAAEQADIFFPATACAEMDGTFVNYEGRAQRFRRALNPGSPVLDTILSAARAEDPPLPAPEGEEMTRGRTVDARLKSFEDITLHPPRTFRKQPPGSDLMPTWQIIARMIQWLTGEEVKEPLADEWAHLRDLDAEGPGVIIAQEAMPAALPSPLPPPE